MKHSEVIIRYMFDFLFIWVGGVCSVKHEHDTWEKAQTVLKTCNPATKAFVTNRQAPQEVVAGGEIIFTYDVKFVVSNSTWHPARICEVLAVSGILPLWSIPFNAFYDVLGLSH